MWRFLAIFLLTIWSACHIADGRKRSRDTSPPPSGMHIMNGICMPLRSDRLVYRHRNDTHVYIAFDILKKGRVDLYWWDILKAVNETVISEMHEETLPVVDFRKTVTREHLLGATGKRHHKSFKNKLRRQMKRCKRRLCHIRSITNVFVRLAQKIRNVQFDKEDCET